MTNTTKRAVTALGLCALVDIASAPAIFAASDSDDSLTFLAFAVLALGVLTVAAALAVARGRGWAIPLALVTRVVDVLGALPGLGAGAGPAAAVVTLTALSVVAVVFVLRLQRAAVPS